MGSHYFEVKSAGRVLSLFEVLATNAAPLSLREIADRMGTPESSTYKLLQTLLHREYVEYTDDGHEYRLGFRLYELLAQDAGQSDLVREFESEARPVVDRLGEAMFLARLDRMQVTYIAEYHGSQPIRFVSHLGMRLPAHATALGKVLLAQLPSAELEKRLPAEGLGILTSRTIATREQLLQE